MMIAAISLIPLTGMVGGGMDMSRLYLTKTRMQHACDAGTLAGRKQMGGGAWNDASKKTAREFFDANFARGAYGSTDLDVIFSEKGGKVSGVVGATLPMTLMRVVGFESQRLIVNCDAEMNLPNTDVMFVLDTTGSMASPAVATDTQSKISGLHNAVKCFYETLAKLPTDAVCAATKPAGGTSGVQIRFGFVPYATNVNVGYLLPTSYLADSWPYQSREFKSSSTAWGPSVQYGQPLRLDGNSSCPSPPPNTATRQYLVNRTTSGFLIFVTTTCTYYYQDQIINTQWRYAKISHKISGLKNGNGWNTSFTLPIGSNGSPKTINWGGCIEERQTVTGTSFTPIPSGAKDLNIDSAPIPGDASTMWGAVLPDLIYTRQSSDGTTNGWNTTEIQSTTAEYANSSTYACPRPAKRLKSWDDPTEFVSYVNSLTPEGNTYHDIGLLWGARLMSPTGIFAADNARTPQGGEIERHLIFMTDGDTQTRGSDYTAYGIPWFDKRNVDTLSTPGSALDNEVNARFEALCTAVKNKNITLWVISFGDGSNTTTETRLSACATSTSYYFKASSSASLQSTFSSIANQISQLRLTK